MSGNTPPDPSKVHPLKSGRIVERLTVRFRRCGPLALRRIMDATSRTNDRDWCGFQAGHVIVDGYRTRRGNTWPAGRYDVDVALSHSLNSPWDNLAASFPVLFGRRRPERA